MAVRGKHDETCAPADYLLAGPKVAEVKLAVIDSGHAPLGHGGIGVGLIGSSFFVTQEPKIKTWRQSSKAGR